jgi:archaellum component FlaC
MEEIVKSLERLDSSIKNAEKEFSSLGGQLKMLQERLEKEYGVKTLDEAEKLISKLEKGVSEGEAEIEQAFTELKNNYDW